LGRGTQVPTEQPAPIFGEPQARAVSCQFNGGTTGGLLKLGTQAPPWGLDSAQDTLSAWSCVSRNAWHTLAGIVSGPLSVPQALSGENRSAAVGQTTPWGLLHLQPEH
jgi:hypothetical protein